MEGESSAGVVESMTLVNFMSHVKLHVEMSPQVNFLTGHNGSGKSAILTALTVGLGGSARYTNRGNSLGELVRRADGVSQARLLIRLRNRGENAFKPDIYGGVIEIERTIAAKGKASGGGLKLRGERGDRVVSTRRVDLEEILFHFDIQMNNPLSVLTQDQARQLLAQGTPAKLYHFFLQGTMLEKLEKEYDEAEKSVALFERDLEEKQVVLEGLKHDYKRASTRAKDAREFLKRTQRLEELERQYAWIHVHEKEKGLAEIERKRSAHEDDLVRLKEAAHQRETGQQAAREKEAALHETQASLEAALRDIEGDQEELKLREKNVERSEKDLARQRTEFDNEKGDLQLSIEMLDAQAQELEAHERESLDEELVVRREETKRKVDELREHLARLEEKSRSHQRDMDQCRFHLSDMDTEAANLRASVQSLAGLLHELKGERDVVKASGQSKIHLFGDAAKLHRLLEQNRHLFKKMPLGPIGMYIEIENTQYADVMDMYFGEILNAFVTTNAADHRVVLELIRKEGLRTSVMLVEEDPTFNCETGEPDRRILTVRRNMRGLPKILDNVLVMRSSVERVALARTQREATMLMSKGPSKVKWCLTADLYRVSMTNNQLSSLAYGETREAERHRNRLGLDAAKTKAKALERRIVEEEARFIEQKEKQAQLAARRDTTAARLDDIDQLVTQTQLERDAVTSQIKELTAFLDRTNPSSSHEAVSLDLERTKAALAEHIAQEHDLADAENVLKRQRAEVSKDFSRLSRRHSETLRAIANNEQDKAAFFEEQGRLAELSENFDAQLDSTRRALAEVDAAYTSASAEIDAMSQSALEICPRPAQLSFETMHDYDVAVSTLRAALEEREREFGATANAVMDEYLAAKKKIVDAAEAIKGLHDYLAELKSGCALRRQKWTEFLHFNARRVSSAFRDHIFARGFFGRLAFDHAARTLAINVAPLDAEQHSAKRPRLANEFRETNALSGGEKSYATTCLLIAMWDVAGCPIRCLDEFDVFMDAVNRRQAIQLMTTKALESRDKQYVFISPQSMGSVQGMQGVRVIHLDDPSRYREGD